MMWGKVIKGSEIVSGAEDETSYRPMSEGSRGFQGQNCWYLLQQICCQHKDISVRPKTLNSSQIANPFLQILLTGHDFQDVEGGP